MAKHITDTGRTREDGPRLREYVRLDKQAARTDVIKALHQSPHAPRTQRLLKEYLRIDRGERS